MIWTERTKHRTDNEGENEMVGHLARMNGKRKKERPRVR